MATSEHRVKTRILVISDTHSALPNPNSAYPFSRPLPRADVAIHCGDLSSTGKLVEHERALTLLKSLPAPLKIVIPGNHDLTLDSEFCSTHADWEFHGNLEDRDHIVQAYDLYNNEAAQQVGIVYLTEGLRSFRLANGADLTIYASAYTPEFCDWAFAYPRHVDRFNSDGEHLPDNPVPAVNQASLMITHGPPYGMLDLTTRGEHVGCEHLTQAVKRCRPLLHCFGHIHEAWGSIRRHWSGGLQPQSTETSEAGLEHVAYADGTDLVSGEETIFVNASIMSRKYVPSQKPWIVDLMLPGTAASIPN